MNKDNDLENNNNWYIIIIFTIIIIGIIILIIILDNRYISVIAIYNITITILQLV